MKHFVSSSFSAGDDVAAVRDLGNLKWRSGIPRGSVGVVLDVDWLGDPRVAFTVEGAWLGGRQTVEKTVTDADIRRIRSAERRMTGT